MIASHLPYSQELQKLRELPEELALREAASFLARLVREPGFLGTEILPLFEGGKGASDWYVASRYEGEDGSFSLQVFVWPAGTGTMIHDHSSWGVYCCAVGTVLEERYQRLDDGSRPGHARLKKVWQLSWGEEDGASTVLPGDEGIHRVGNPYGEVAVSVHLYGPRTGEVDGRDYDPSHDYVCDRSEDQDPPQRRYSRR